MWDGASRDRGQIRPRVSGQSRRGLGDGGVFSASPELAWSSYCGISPAGADRQHVPLRIRRLLAKRREIEKLAGLMQAKGVSIVPLKIYFKNGFAKLLVGVGTGKTKSDKRQSISKRESQREIDRALHRRRP